ncbi:MAG: ABC transporter permease [Paracoccaceae bacterium]
MHRTGSRGFYFFLIIFTLFVIFLYGPMFSIILLSFQGPEGGLTFPMNGVSFHWFGELWRGAGVVDIGSAFRRSLVLGFVVMILTVTLSVAAGLAFRKKFKGSELLFLTTIASLIVPSIVLSLGVALEFRLLDETVKWFGEAFGIEKINYEFQTTLGMFTSGMGTQLTWTLPFGLLIMFAVFNRFDKSYEEAAQDLGASQWQTLKEVVLPIIAPSIIGIGLFGFTLSYDELARSSQVMGATNTLPLELRGLTTTVTTPIIYALGTLTTLFSFLVIGIFFLSAWLLSSARSKSES